VGAHPIRVAGKPGRLTIQAGDPGFPHVCLNVRHNLRQTHLGSRAEKRPQAAAKEDCISLPFFEGLRPRLSFLLPSVTLQAPLREAVAWIKRQAIFERFVGNQPGRCEMDPDRAVPLSITRPGIGRGEATRDASPAFTAGVSIAIRQGSTAATRSYISDRAGAAPRNVFSLPGCARPPNGRCGRKIRQV
jgi:hypothetical protein